MLMKTDVVYQKTPTPQESARHVTGQYLARNRLDDDGHARLAADLLDGRAILGPLTTKQIIALCRAKQARVTALRDPDRRNRLRQLRLKRAWESLDPDHRAEFCRVVGIENIWKVLAAAVG